MFLQFILLGAVPFPSDVPQLKELGVCGVITLNEPYETLVPSSLYKVCLFSIFNLAILSFGFFHILTSFNFLWKSYCIDHLVIATRDYCFAPSMEAICQAVEFIHSKLLILFSYVFLPLAIIKKLTVCPKLCSFDLKFYFVSLKEMLRLERRLMFTAKRVGVAAQLLSYATWFVLQLIPEKQFDQRHFISFSLIIPFQRRFNTKT